MYQLPNGKKVIRTWGTAETPISINAMFTSADYLDKLKSLAQLVSFSTDLEGFEFNHPTMGTFKNAHIVSTALKEAPSQLFNGTFVEISIVTGEVFNVELSPTPPLRDEVTNYINQAIGTAQTISTLVNLEQDIAVTVSPILDIAGSDATIQNNTNGQVVANFSEPTFSNPNFTGVGSGSIKSEITEINPEFGNAVQTLTNNGLSFDFDLLLNVKLICENLTSFTGEQIAGYGSGYISETTETTELVSSISTIQYTEDYTDSSGNEFIINKKLLGTVGDLYKIQVTTTEYTPVPTNYQLITAKQLIDNVVVYLAVVSSLDETVLGDSSNLIATLENFYNYIRFEVRNNYIVNNVKSVIGVAIENDTTPQEIISNNPQLVAYKPLVKGMEITL